MNLYKESSFFFFSLFFFLYLTEKPSVGVQEDFL